MTTSGHKYKKEKRHKNRKRKCKNKELHRRGDVNGAKRINRLLRRRREEEQEGRKMRMK